MRHLNTISDLTAPQLRAILNSAHRMQKHVDRHRVLPPLLRGFCLGMVFDEPSLRTRSAFERAMVDLGGHAIHYTGSEARIGRNANKQEHLPDFVHVAGRFNDALLARIYDHAVQARIAALCPVPFINGMCDLHHPTQAICDLLTIERHFDSVAGLKIAFIGDGTNIARSLVQACVLLGVEIAVATPHSMRLGTTAGVPPGAFIETADPVLAVAGAHAVVTDAWVPMHRDHERAQRRAALAPYRVTQALMKLAHPRAIFMHNLPAQRGDEVEADVIDGPQSAIHEEAVARLHVARSILLHALRSDATRVVQELGK